MTCTVPSLELFQSIENLSPACHIGPMRVFPLIVILFLSRFAHAHCADPLMKYFDPGKKPLWTVAPEVEALNRKPVTSVTVGQVKPEDYQAKILEDGYQLVTDLPKLKGMTESELYQELIGIFGDESRTTLVFGPDGKAYRWEGEIRYGEKNHIVLRQLKEIKIPPEFDRYLKARIRYLHHIPEAAASRHHIDSIVDSSVEVRLGSQLKNPFTGATRTFHFDGDVYYPGSIWMAETLNRGELVQGTIVVGKAGNVFETKANESLLFAAQGFLLTPPGMHASPATDGPRIFLRYTGPFQKSDKELANLQVNIDMNGNFLF